MIVKLEQLLIENCDRLEKTIIELKQKNEFILSILTSIPDDIIIVNKQKIITWSNNKKLINSNIADLDLYIRPKYKNLCPFDYVFSTGETINFETKINEMFFYHILTPCNFNGSILTVLELKRNVTEHKKINEFEGLQNLINQVVISQEKLNNTIMKVKGL
jgi:hypothetical protein